jgi:hypothetical protein
VEIYIHSVCLHGVHRRSSVSTVHLYLNTIIQVYIGHGYIWDVLEPFVMAVLVRGLPSSYVPSLCSCQIAPAPVGILKAGVDPDEKKTTCPTGNRTSHSARSQSLLALIYSFNYM